MSMQLSCVDPQPTVLPMSDIDKLKEELLKINEFLRDISTGTATKATYEHLKAAVMVINEIILSLDNSNDFFKIGGFNQLLPLLGCSEAEIVAATAELIADLCQNNTFCQSKSLDFNILPELVKLLDMHYDSQVRSKSLYAISCLCRHNQEAIRHLEITNIIPVMMRILQSSDEKLRARTAFFLSHLSTYDNFRESFYKADVVGVLIKQLSEEDDSSTEHLLNALWVQVSKHLQSRVQCRGDNYDLKDILLGKIQSYDSKEEYDEAREHCNQILALCFPEKKSKA